MKKNGFPEGSIQVTQTSDDQKDHAKFKQRILNEFQAKGWIIFAAYGDSSTDFEAYSEMMMETQIDLELEEALEPEFRAALQGAVTTLKGKRDGADAEMRKDLKFEIEGLYALRDQLA